MPIIIKDCHFKKNGTGIKAPTSADIQMSGTRFVANGKALDIYVSAADLEHLGLPADTPQEFLEEIISALQSTTDESEKINVVKESRLFQWLGNAASLSNIATALVQFVRSLS